MAELSLSTSKLPKARCELSPFDLATAAATYTNKIAIPLGKQVLMMHFCSQEELQMCRNVDISMGMHVITALRDSGILDSLIMECGPSVDSQADPCPIHISVWMVWIK